MKVAYIGNFGPEHSTENHMAQAWERQGHEVVRLQENQAATWNPDPWQISVHRDHPWADLLGLDLVLWTRTGWDWPNDTGWTTQEAWEKQDTVLDLMSERGIPTVGFHLDRWWGLDREGQVYDEPFFRCSLVCTADGGHDQAWIDAGVNHHWLPPGVSLAETEREGRVLARAYPGRVGFVGSWKRGYHKEWDTHRQDMLAACRKHYRRAFVCYPRGGRGIRGQALADLYATIPVMVGDSCLPPFLNPPARYWSDRIPETIGRGGLLVHPRVEGLLQEYPVPALRTYELGDLEAMLDQVDSFLAASPAEQAQWRAEGKAWVQEHHSYERRVEQIIELVEALDV